MKHKFIIGSRGSQLALWQTEYVKTKLQNRFPETEFEVRIITTKGDAILDTALSKIGDKGLFTKQIEDELLNGTIDLAVHSLKDLPTRLPVGLKIGAVTERDIPNDVLIAKDVSSIDELPENARVATGSLRRKSQLLRYRNDLQIAEIRGNVPTRIRKFEESDLDAMVLAFAGIKRLGLEEYIKQIIPTEIMIPAVGQGAVAVEIREDDEETQELVGSINDALTEICVSAERSFLRVLEGGCQVPIGAIAAIVRDKIKLEGFVGNFDGSVTLRDSIIGDGEAAEALGHKLADKMIAEGAGLILSEARMAAQQSQNEVI